MRTRSIHVMPINDTMLHGAHESCPCYPFETERGLYVHNAKDCREAKERVTGDMHKFGWEAVLIDSDTEGLSEEPA